MPNGEVYINDKKVADLDNKGQASFKDYEITPGSLYVKKSGIGKSDTIEDFDQYVTAPADQESDDDDDYCFSDDESDSSDQIKAVNGSEDWADGSSNVGYLSIKKLHDNWDDDDSVSSFVNKYRVP